MRRIKAGSTDVSIVIRIVDATDGTPETGVTSATSGLDLKYRREGAAAVDLTESDLSALNDAHSDGGLLHIGAGYYRVDVPDAAFAANASGVLIFGTVTGMIVIGEYVELEVNTAADVMTRLGSPAGASIAADIATMDGNVDLILEDTGTTLPSSLSGLDGKLDTIDGNVDAVLVDTGTTLPATLATILGHIDTEIAAILEDTGTTIPGLLATIDGKLDTIDGNVDAILVDTDTTIPGLINGLNDFDPSTDTVTLADGGLTAAKIASGAFTAAKFASGAIDAAALSADAAQEIRDVILAGEITELAVDPGASPTLEGALGLLYMAVRNKRETTADTDTLHNNAGTAVFEAAVSDDGVTFSRGKYGAA